MVVSTACGFDVQQSVTGDEEVSPFRGTEGELAQIEPVFSFNVLLFYVSLSPTEKYVQSG